MSEAKQKAQQLVNQLLLEQVAEAVTRKEWEVAEELVRIIGVVKQTPVTFPWSVPVTTPVLAPQTTPSVGPYTPGQIYCRTADNGIVTMESDGLLTATTPVQRS